MHSVGYVKDAASVAGNSYHHRWSRGGQMRNSKGPFGSAGNPLRSVYTPAFQSHHHRHLRGSQTMNSEGQCGGADDPSRSMYSPAFQRCSQRGTMGGPSRSMYSPALQRCSKRGTVGGWVDMPGAQVPPDDLRCAVYDPKQEPVARYPGCEILEPHQPYWTRKQEREWESQRGWPQREAW